MSEISNLIPGDSLFSEYLKYTAPFSESPPVFHVFTLGHTISSLIGRGRHIQQGEDTIYPNLYTIIMAPSSLYKKSSSSGLYVKQLGRLDYLKGHYIGHIGSPEGLFKGLQENHGTGFIYYSEFGSLLAASNKKWMVDIIDILNDLYDCPNYYSKRLQSGQLAINNCFLNILGASQLESMTAHIKEGTLLSGFLPRFAVVYSEELKPHLVRRPPPDLKKQNSITKALNQIRQASQEPQQMILSPEAWGAFEKWAMKRHQEALVAPPPIQPIYGRLETHALKFAIIISLGIQPSSLEINDIVISYAVEWADFILNSYRRLVLEELTFNMDDRKLKKVSDLIKGAGSISYRDIISTVRLKPRDLKEILETIRAMGKIREGKGPKGGRIYEWIN